MQRNCQPGSALPTFSAARSSADMTVPKSDNAATRIRTSTVFKNNSLSISYCWMKTTFVTMPLSFVMTEQVNFPFSFMYSALSLVIPGLLSLYFLST